MGLIYADLRLSNESRSGGAIEVTVRALVDTGALFMCVPSATAAQLGFDVTEVRQRIVTLADGRSKSVPVIAPVTIYFENRWYTTEALVLGDEALLGVIPMEAMDVMVEPRTQRLIVNPLHPNFAVASAKSAI